MDLVIVNIDVTAVVDGRGANGIGSMNPKVPRGGDDGELPVSAVDSKVLPRREPLGNSPFGDHQPEFFVEFPVPLMEEQP